MYAVPVGEDFAVVVDLDLQHLVSIQPAGNGPTKRLEGAKQTQTNRLCERQVYGTDMEITLCLLSINPSHFPLISRRLRFMRRQNLSG